MECLSHFYDLSTPVYVLTTCLQIHQVSNLENKQLVQNVASSTYAVCLYRAYGVLNSPPTTYVYYEHAINTYSSCTQESVKQP